MMKTLTQSDLRQFSGTQQLHKASILAHGSVVTDGVKFVADTAGAYWLIDMIMSHHMTNSKLRVRDERYFWKLKKTDQGWSCICTDGGKGKAPVTLARQDFEYSDFPLDEIDIDSYPYYNSEGNQTGWILMLPSEN